MNSDIVQLRGFRKLLFTVSAVIFVTLPIIILFFLDRGTVWQIGFRPLLKPETLVVALVPAVMGAVVLPWVYGKWLEHRDRRFLKEIDEYFA